MTCLLIDAAETGIVIGTGTGIVGDDRVETEGTVIEITIETTTGIGIGTLGIADIIAVTETGAGTEIATATAINPTRKAARSGTQVLRLALEVLPPRYSVCSPRLPHMASDQVVPTSHCTILLMHQIT